MNCVLIQALENVLLFLVTKSYSLVWLIFSFFLFSPGKFRFINFRSSVRALVQL